MQTKRLKVDHMEAVLCNGMVHDVLLRKDLEADESGYRLQKFMRFALNCD